MIYLEVKENSKQAKMFIEFAKTLSFIHVVDEESKDYKQFVEDQVKEAIKSKRIKSGNSLRQII